MKVLDKIEHLGCELGGVKANIDMMFNIACDGEDVTLQNSLFGVSEHLNRIINDLFDTTIDIMRESKK